VFVADDVPNMFHLVLFSPSSSSNSMPCSDTNLESDRNWRQYFVQLSEKKQNKNTLTLKFKEFSTKLQHLLTFDKPGEAAKHHCGSRTVADCRRVVSQSAASGCTKNAAPPGFPTRESICRAEILPTLESFDKNNKYDFNILQISINVHLHTHFIKGKYLPSRNIAESLGKTNKY
jgi:hypothetical protein